MNKITPPDSLYVRYDEQICTVCKEKGEHCEQPTVIQHICGQDLDTDSQVNRDHQSSIKTKRTCVNCSQPTKNYTFGNVNLENETFNSVQLPPQDQLGRSELHNAVIRGDLRTAQACINSGLMLNLQDNYGATPLLTAVNENNLRFVELLINAGADMTIKDHYEFRPLQLAVRRGYLDVALKLIAAKAEINTFGAYDQTPFHSTLKSFMNTINPRDLDSLTIKNIEKLKSTPPQNKQIADAFELQLISKAMIEADADLESPLRLIKITPVCIAAEQNFLIILSALIDRGVNVNCCHGSFSPLDLAVQKGNLEAVRMLLEAGANPNRRYVKPAGLQIPGLPIYSCLDPYNDALERGHIEIAQLIKNKIDEKTVSGGRVFTII